MEDSTQQIRSLGSITKTEASQASERTEKAVKALMNYLVAQADLLEVRYLWYLAEYEGRTLEGKPGTITTEELESVVRRFGRALSLKVASEYELRVLLGL